MKKQIVKFKRVGTSTDGKPLYELDNSTMSGQRSLPDEFRATVIFLPDEKESSDSKVLGGNMDKVIGAPPNREL